MIFFFKKNNIGALFVKRGCDYGHGYSKANYYKRDAGYYKRDADESKRGVILPPW